MTYETVSGFTSAPSTTTYEDLKISNAGLGRRDRNDWRVDIDDVNIVSITVTLENTAVKVSWQSFWDARVELETIEYCIWDDRRRLIESIESNRTGIN